MPFLNPTDSPIAQLTDFGRAQLARETLGEVGFKFFGWAVGREGYDDADPVKVDPILGTELALGDQVFPILPTPPATFDAFEFPNLKAISLVSRLDRPDGNFGLGELGIFCEFTFSVIPAEIGTRFLFALAHFPLQAKTDRHIYVFRTIIQF